MRADATTGRAFKGSQRWLQTFVENAPAPLSPAHLGPLEWHSPVPQTRFQEYRDGAFLDVLGLGYLTPRLASFWPKGGAVWDGLATSARGPVLVEAKAHIKEAFSSPSAAKAPASMARISGSLSQCKRALGADERSDWSRCYYQTANRIAHLWWLHQNNVLADLVFVHFVGDTEVNGPLTPAPWHAAEQAAHYALGLPSRHPLSDFIHYTHPDVRNMQSP